MWPSRPRTIIIATFSGQQIDSCIRNSLSENDLKKRTKKATEPESRAQPVVRDPNTTPGRDGGRRHKVGIESADRILDTARKLFAQRGFDGTPIRRITVAAGVNVGAVTYHFGTKRDLYYEVIKGFVGPLARQLELIAAEAAAPPAKIERMVRFFFQHVRSHPEMVPLMVREMAGEGTLPPPIQAMISQAIPLLAGIIAAGQHEGAIRAGDPLLLALSTLAQPVYLNLARKGIAAAAGLNANDPAVFDRVVDHCVTVVRAALEVRP